MKSKQQFQKKLFMSSVHNNEEGIVLIITLSLLAIIALVATVVFNTTNTDIKISSNYKTSTQAFSEAEAGTEEARARLRANADANFIPETATTTATWAAYIGTLTSAVSLGYDTGNPNHSIRDSIQTGLDYYV